QAGAGVAPVPGSAAGGVLVVVGEGLVVDGVEVLVVGRVPVVEAAPVPAAAGCPDRADGVPLQPVRARASRTAPATVAASSRRRSVIAGRPGARDCPAPPGAPRRRPRRSAAPGWPS